MIISKPICFKCKHFQDREKEHWFRCAAFPNGIPDEIFTGIVVHTKKYPGDKGIRFEENSLDDKAGKVLAKMNYDIIEKDWSDWSKFRKPKYEPSNKKSVSACRKFIEHGVMKPGCARAVMLAENLYEPGKDENSYIPFEPVDPKKFFSQVKEDREKEQQKKNSLDEIDRVLDSCDFFRDSLGRIIISNWMSLPPEQKKLLAGLFDEKGILLDTKYAEFDHRIQDFNSRRLARGQPSKQIR